MAFRTSLISFPLRVYRLPLLYQTVYLSRLGRRRCEQGAEALERRIGDGSTAYGLHPRQRCITLNGDSPGYVLLEDLRGRLTWMNGLVYPHTRSQSDKQGFQLEFPAGSTTTNAVVTLYSREGESITVKTDLDLVRCSRGTSDV